MKAKNNWLYIFQARVDRFFAVEPVWYILLPGIVFLLLAIVLLGAIVLDKL